MAKEDGPFQLKGKITFGVARDTLVSETLEFVARQLPDWRDDPSRPVANDEKVMNSQLCKFLNSRANSAFPMVQFHHEERQTGRAQVDLSASGSQSLTFGTWLHSIYEPFLVFEAKRLPAPSRDREMEYVTGRSRRNGGIQRFKLALHGAGLKTVAMIGYIESETPVFWYRQINLWIRQLSEEKSGDICPWNLKEKLSNLDEDGVRGSSVCRSFHSRSVGDRFVIRHLWLVMQQ